MCGIVGTYGVPDVATTILESFPMLRHRGQGTTGMVLSDGKAFLSPAPYHASGMLRSLPDTLYKKALLGVGHLRYPTSGVHVAMENAQPIIVPDSPFLCVAHNGDTPGFAAMREELKAQGIQLHSSADTEVIAQRIALEAKKTGDLKAAMLGVFSILKSAYSLVMATPKALIAARDPWGYRPLSLARLDEGWVLASETCAFDALRAEYVRDIEPGELVWIDKYGVQSTRFAEPKPALQQCVFEPIYFSRPDSKVYGRHVDGMRKALGEKLAEEVGPLSHEDMIVVPVPDSAMFAADGYAKAAKIPLDHALIRNHYFDPDEQRTFIGEGERREDNVRMKFNPVRHRVEGRWVALIDDSLVRGTTMKRLVSMMKGNGAVGVTVLIASPPILHPCRYGIDMKDYDQLIAATRKGDVEAIREFIGADELFYLSLKGLKEVANEEGREQDFCLACFNGKYAF